MKKTGLPTNKPAAKAALNANAQAWLVSVRCAGSLAVVTGTHRELATALVCRDLACVLDAGGRAPHVVLTGAGSALADKLMATAAVTL